MRSPRAYNSMYRTLKLIENRIHRESDYLNVSWSYCSTSKTCKALPKHRMKVKNFLKATKSLQYYNPSNLAVHQSQYMYKIIERVKNIEI